MLGLQLREEFRDRRLKGTAIELSNDNKTGATQIAAASFLEITYPTMDLLKAIEAAGPSQGRPIVFIGERGQGKSHLLAAMHHALTSPAATQEWLGRWSERLGNPRIATLPLRDRMHVVTEVLHKHRYKYLWDLIFERHPRGDYYRGSWERHGDRKTDVPSDKLLLDMLREQPLALLLDEFQTWFDGLTNSRQAPNKTWAFNFVQILSEIAKEHPELLLLVVTVRNGSTDAYQQIHRTNPVAIDFAGPSADVDRRRLLLHRLFSNRTNIPQSEIERVVAPQVSEYLRLAGIAPSEHDRRRSEFLETWPFAPHLMQLLEDQVLVATEAQETRDLIKILADLWKSRGERSPVLTAGDFRLDDDQTGIGSLLNSVASAHHSALRDRAQRNLSAVAESLDAATVPHAAELISSLWIRSLAVGNLVGAEPRTLQIDLTRDRPLDDNAFQVELSAIVDSSFNIHRVGDRLLFKEEENPQAKLMAYAKNDRLFTDGSDRRGLSHELRYVLGGSEEIARGFRVVVLPATWQSDPWSSLDEGDRPERWDDRLLILVVPDNPERLDEKLGQFLKEHVPRRRNTIRFLLPRAGQQNLYFDRDLLLLARAVLKAKEWAPQNAEYAKLHRKYEKDLRDALKQRFDRFAVLRKWDFADPARCHFQIEPLAKQGAEIPQDIEKRLKEDVFVAEDFDDAVLAAASNNDSVGKLLRELQEPRPNQAECIPWLGEPVMKDKLVRLCARGRIALNVRGTEYLQAMSGEAEDVAFRRMASKLGTGKHLDETLILLPQSVPEANRVEGTPSQPGMPTEPSPSAPLLELAALPGYPKAGDGPVGGWQPTQPAVPNRKQFASSETSALNLLGQVEKWQIGPGSVVHEVILRIPVSKGEHLLKLLRALPDGQTYQLSLEKTERDPVQERG